LIDFISDDGFNCSISWHYVVSAADIQRKLCSLKRWPKRVLLFKTWEGS